MNRLKLWSEQVLPSSAAGEAKMVRSVIRPAPLRTVGTYDDDTFFNSTALNMLSRYEGLNITPYEAISTVLTSPRSQSSFLDGLNSRLSRSSHMSPSTQELLLKANLSFGPELRKIVGGSGKNSSGERCPPPTTPRHCAETTSQTSVNSSRKKKRSFFPDCELFRSRKVKNIDWSMVSAIEQVQTLSLDGSTSTTTSASDRSNSYRPPAHTFGG